MKDKSRLAMCTTPKATVAISARRNRLAISGAAALAGLAAVAGDARAEFQVCNQSLDVLNVAIGYDDDGDFLTEGWWSIGANRCVDLIRETLLDRYVYVYAEDVFGQAAVAGDVAMCVGAKKFVIRGIKDCWNRGHQEAHFIEVDTQSQERWTLFLKGAD